MEPQDKIKKIGNGFYKLVGNDIAPLRLDLTKERKRLSETLSFIDQNIARFVKEKETSLARITEIDTQIVDIDFIEPTAKDDVVLDVKAEAVDMKIS